MRATRSGRCRPYLATTGLRTSVTGFVGLAFSPTERLIGTKSSLERRSGLKVLVATDAVFLHTQLCLQPNAGVPEESALF